LTTLPPPKLLSTRINSESLTGKTFYDIHYEIVDEGFKRDFKFEITSVQKHLDQNFAWVRSTTPEEAINLRAQKVYVDFEVLVPRFAPKANCRKMTKPKNKPYKL
jgi:hypothetical protein